MYQLQFINLVYDTTKLTHLEQTNINLFIGNWSNHQLQNQFVYVMAMIQVTINIIFFL